jgi:NAD(P)-dependent dehydrogenase (short-subunit alcohol dehydrogenase family)
MCIMNDLFSLEGKTALVTGAGRGIGQAIAIAFAAAGADVALASRTQAELEETAAEIKTLSHNAVVLPVDLNHIENARQLVDEAVQSLGKLDILVTSSGTIVRKPAIELEDEDWDMVLQLNLKARFFVSQAAARHMQTIGGSIIHIGSLSAFFGIPNIMAYTASNGGLASMMRAQAIEWASYGIRVNSIAPGTVMTRQTEQLLENPEVLASRLAKIPLNRLGKPEDVAGAAVFLASQAAAYITGHMLVVDGGWLASGGGLKG